MSKIMLKEKQKNSRCHEMRVGVHIDFAKEDFK